MLSISTWRLRLSTSVRALGLRRADLGFGDVVAWTGLGGMGLGDLQVISSTWNNASRRVASSATHLMQS